MSILQLTYGNTYIDLNTDNGYFNITSYFKREQEWRKMTHNKLLSQKQVKKVLLSNRFALHCAERSSIKYLVLMLPNLSTKKAFEMASKAFNTKNFTELLNNFSSCSKGARITVLKRFLTEKQYVVTNAENETWVILNLLTFYKFNLGTT